MANRYRSKVLWRDTMREPRLTIFDARLIFFLLLLAVHLALWTLFLLVAAIIVFWLVERAGYRFPSAMRTIRATFAGTARPARHRSQYRQPIDYGFEYRQVRQLPTLKNPQSLLQAKPVDSVYDDPVAAE